jgi:hypothetical protein
MAEYIERGALLRAIEELNDGENWMVSQYNADWIYSFIDAADKADVVEVVHGEWIPIEHEYRNKFERVMIADEFDCGICGRRLGYRANYCPNCGAKMDGKDEKI